MLNLFMACASLLLGGAPAVGAVMPSCAVPLPSICDITLYDSDNDVMYNRPVRPYGIGDTLTVSMGQATTFYFDGDIYFADNDGYYAVVEDAYSVTIWVDGDAVSDVEVKTSSSDLDLMTDALIVLPESYGSSMASIHLPDLSYFSDQGEDGYAISLVCMAGLNSDCAYYVNGGTLNAWTYSLAELGEDVNPIDAIGDGLGVVGALGGALGNGFDAVFVDNGALTAVGTFGFILLGLGISVGIVKKCFNWVTGRHGM